MSRENVARARKLLTAFNRRDVAQLVRMTTDDYDFRPLTAGELESTVYRGHTGIAAYFRDTEATWKALRMEPREFRDLGDSILVVATLHGRGRKSEVDVELPFFGVLTLRGDKFAAAQAFATEEEALEAVGLRE